MCFICGSGSRWSELHLLVGYSRRGLGEGRGGKDFQELSRGRQTLNVTSLHGGCVDPYSCFEGGVTVKFLHSCPSSIFSSIEK